MNDDQLERSLQSIGKGCVVEYFCEFADKSISDRLIIEMLMRHKRYTESGSRTRVSQARRIIRAGRAEDALRNIIRSERITNYGQVSAKARALLSRAAS